jgi:hypothetical protein
MALRKRTRGPLAVELPSERDAMEVAWRIANELASKSQGGGGFVTVTDEHGKIVGKVRVPAKQKH